MQRIRTNTGDSVGVYTVVGKSISDKENNQTVYTLRCSVCGRIITRGKNVLPSYRKENRCLCGLFPSYKKSEVGEQVGDVFGIYKIIKVYKGGDGTYKTRFVCTSCGNIGVIPYSDGLKNYAALHPECMCVNKGYITCGYNKSAHEKAMNLYSSFEGKSFGRWAILKSYTHITTSNKKKGTVRTEYWVKARCALCGKEKCFHAHLFKKPESYPECDHHIVCHNHAHPSLVKSYREKVGSTLNGFFVYDYVPQKHVGRNGHSHYYRILCPKCGKLKFVSCYSLISNNLEKLKHVCKPPNHERVHYNDAIRGNSYVYGKDGRETIAIDAFDLLNVRENYLSEFSCVYGTESFMEAIAQASIDGKLHSFNGLFSIEPVNYKHTDKELSLLRKYPKCKTVWYDDSTGKKRIRHFKKWKHGRRKYCKI